MSRSNNIDLINPSTRKFEWKGGEGYFTYYDKDLGTTVVVEKPFRFMVLDVLNTIVGFSDADSSGIWSNEVRKLKEQPFVVRTKGRIIATGPYENIKDTVKAQGGRFGQAIYCCFDTPEGFKIGKVEIYGAALGGGESDPDKKPVPGWIDFRNKARNLYKDWVVVKDAVKCRKGGTVYYVPVFETEKASDGDNDQAIYLDQTLQEYFEALFAHRASQADTAPHGRRAPQSVPLAQGNIGDDFPQGVPRDAIPVPADDDLPF